MSEENVEIARRVFALWEQGSFSASDLLDPNIRFETFMPDSREDVRTRGLEELSAFLVDFLQEWDDYRLIGDEFLSVGDDTVLVKCRQAAKGRQSRAEVESPGFAVLAIEDGRVSELFVHYEERRVLEAAGLAEAEPQRRNPELARRVFAAITRFDLDALLDLADPDVEYRSFFAIGETGEYHGHDGLRQYVSDLRETWEVLEPTMEDSIAVDDVVVGVGTIAYRGKGSGVEAKDPAGWLFKFRDGKMVLFRAFREPAKALEAVGGERER
jgi:ketosteroid isomerase-like protein